MARARLRRQRGRPIMPIPPKLGRDLRKVTHKSLKGGGSALSKLQDRWASLVGDHLAETCYPMKLTGAKTGRTLTLRVIPAAAALIQHQEETIRQRLSVAAGGNVTRLRIEQGALPGPKRPVRKTLPPLSPSEEAELDATTQGIANPALKAAIVALGRAVLADESD